LPNYKWITAYSPFTIICFYLIETKPLMD